MAQEKMNLQWIANDTTRRLTFKKRTNALMKKANELTTLCGVKVSVVAYGEDGAMPEVYPSVPEAMQLLSSFKAIPDDLENLKKVVNLEDYLRGRISKLKDQKMRSDMEKHEDQTSDLLHAAMARQGPGLSSLTMEQLASLKFLVERRMRYAKTRFEQITGHELLQEPMLPQGKPIFNTQLKAPSSYTLIAPAKEPQPQQPKFTLQPEGQQTFTVQPQEPNFTPQVQVPNTYTEIGHAKEPLPKQPDFTFQQQEQPKFTPEQQASYTYTEKAPAQEPQPEEQDWLMDFSWNEGDELSTMAYNDIDYTNSGAGPSNSRADIEPHNNIGLEFPWSWDPFPNI